MKKNKKKTAGELSLKAAADNTVYDPLEVGYALTDGVVEQLMICAKKHESLFDEDEFFLGLFIASDPLIKNLRRHKYAAFLFMPMPRPEQSVYIYNRHSQKIKRLWSLPSAFVMATISNMPFVAPQWQLTKSWCDAFFYGWKPIIENGKVIRIENTTPHHFHNLIRKQNNIFHYNEKEYLDSHRQELIQAGNQDMNSTTPDAFDFSKVTIEHIIDTKTALTE
jgi:hypothetical protein